MKAKKTYFRHHIYLTQDAMTKLKALCKKSGQSHSSIIRALIDGAAIREMPPIDYHKLISEVRAVGNNINQIARVANTTGNINKTAYEENAAELRRALSEIQLAFFKR
ncbi:MobC family plasmid mobilization relaxosome protein [Oscillospiraceae bacterium OttesenSCG-928-F05]|nr:MobC family plasmid mobilization relaxosome protein [Oscillospiraceae bacterium OttesenSCG-928-F05]